MHLILQHRRNLQEFMPPALIFYETFHHKDPSELEAISRLDGTGLGGVSFESQPVGS